MIEDALLFLDIETTGLTHGEDLLLEVGMIVTDMQLNELQDGRISFLVHWSTGQLDEYLQGKDFVREMHTKNGLLQEVATSPLGEDEDIVLIRVKDWIVDYQNMHEIKNFHPAGSSVHFDVTWLDYEFLYKVGYPSFSKAANLHHRYYDVSAIKMFLQMTVADGEYNPGPEDEHRALSDLENDIAWVKLAQDS